VHVVCCTAYVGSWHFSDIASGDGMSAAGGSRHKSPEGDLGLGPEAVIKPMPALIRRAEFVEH